MSRRPPTLLAMLALVAAAPSGCAGFERGAALSLDHHATPGVRGTLGMPKGRRRLLVTQAAVAVDTGGFFSIAGGVSLRAPTGLTPRLDASFGVAAEGHIAADCQVVNEREECKDGLGPYGEADLGVDVPLGGILALTVVVGGNVYLNGEELETRARALVGVTWK